MREASVEPIGFGTLYLRTSAGGGAKRRGDEEGRGGESSETRSGLATAGSGVMLGPAPPASPLPPRPMSAAPPRRLAAVACLLAALPAAAQDANDPAVEEPLSAGDAAIVGTRDWTTLPKADCHVHLVDFLQNGEFWSDPDGPGGFDGQFVPPSPGAALAQGDRGARIESVLRRMDAADVRVAMISGMPFVKKWSRSDPVRSKYYLDSGARVVRARDTDYTVALAVEDYLDSGAPNVQENRARLYPFVCGFDSTDLGGVDMIVKRIKEFPGLREGIGEVMSRHDDLTNLTTGERPSGDHPALHRVCDFAGEMHLPVSVHHNVAPVSPGGQFRDPLYLREIESLFDAHPDTQFIWCHAGISRRVVVRDLPGLLRGMLSEPGRAEHVKIDLSWVVYENYIYSEASARNPLAVDQRAEWAALIADYPENFVIGSDIVAKFDGYAAEINKYGPLFDVLVRQPNGEALVRGLAHDNFADLMARLRTARGGSGATLPTDYVYPEDRFTLAGGVPQKAVGAGAVGTGGAGSPSGPSTSGPRNPPRDVDDRGNPERTPQTPSRVPTPDRVPVPR